MICNVRHMPNLVTTAQKARQLGVDVRTVHRMVERGELVPVAKGEGIRGPYFFEVDAEPQRVSA